MYKRYTEVAPENAQYFSAQSGVRALLSAVSARVLGLSHTKRQSAGAKRLAPLPKELSKQNEERSV